MKRRWRRNKRRDRAIYRPNCLTPHVGSEQAVFRGDAVTLGWQAPSMKRALLCSNNQDLGLKVLYCLHRGGYEVDVLSLLPSSAIRCSRYRSNYREATKGRGVPDTEAAVEWINREAPARGWEAVIGDDIASHAWLHEVHGQLAVPAFAPSQRSVPQECHDKWSFYRKLAANGIAVPVSRLLQGPEQITEEYVEAVGFPLLVKPLNAESGDGIVKFSSFSPLRAYLLASERAGAFPLKIQRFIRGHTIGLSLLAVGGRLVTHDVQLHADSGARVFYQDDEVVEMGSRIVQAFSYAGPGHIDLIREDATAQLYALEFNCRFWYSVTVSLWQGGNFPALALRLARSQLVPSCATRRGAYFQPGMVVGMWRRPAMWMGLTRANWQGLWQAISDPIPHLVNHLH